MPLPRHIVLEVYVEGIGRIGHFYPATEKMEIDPAGAVLGISPQRLVDIMRALIKRNRAGMVLDTPVVVFPLVTDSHIQPSSIPGMLEPVDHGNTLIKPAIDADALRRHRNKRMQEEYVDRECRHYEVSQEERLNILAYFGADSLSDLTDAMWMRWEKHRRTTDRVDAVLEKMNGEEWAFGPDGVLHSSGERDYSGLEDVNREREGQLRTLAEMLEALREEGVITPKEWEELQQVADALPDDIEHSAPVPLNVEEKPYHVRVWEDDDYTPEGA